MSQRGLTAEALRGSRAVVMGLGRFGGGIGAARYLERVGARVLATDLRSAAELPEACAALAGSSVELRLDGHDAADFEGADVVVANPAVRPDHPLLVRARERGARIATEIELFLAAAPCRLVGITGTQGKSSTTAFLAALLGANGRRAHAGGNLGGSMLEHVDALGPDDWVVLELSSYQLEMLGSPPAGAATFRAVGVTNIESDHLERHGGPQGYAAAKQRILELAAPGCEVWLPDGAGPTQAWTSSRAEVRRFDPSAGTADATVACAMGAIELPGPARLGLPAFQAANLRLAYGMALGLGLDAAELVATSAALRAPRHRLERLADVAGAAVFDNGVSTTPDSTASALLCLDAPVVLLVGGRRKELPLLPLLEAARGRVSRAHAFGESAQGLASELAAVGIAARAHAHLEGAVSEAVRELRRGDTLLFSPACASFDAFANFEDRARSFRAALEGSAEAYPKVRSRIS